MGAAAPAEATAAAPGVTAEQYGEICRVLSAASGGKVFARDCPPRRNWTDWRAIGGGLYARTVTDGVEALKVIMPFFLWPLLYVIGALASRSALKNVTSLSHAATTVCATLHELGVHATPPNSRGRPPYGAMTAAAAEAALAAVPGDAAVPGLHWQPAALLRVVRGMWEKAMEEGGGPFVLLLPHLVPRLVHHEQNIMSAFNRGGVLIMRADRGSFSVLGACVRQEGVSRYANVACKTGDDCITLYYNCVHWRHGGAALPAHADTCEQ